MDDVWGGKGGGGEGGVGGQSRSLSIANKRWCCFVDDVDTLPQKAVIQS